MATASLVQVFSPAAGLHCSKLAEGVCVRPSSSKFAGSSGIPLRHTSEKGASLPRKHNLRVAAISFPGLNFFTQKKGADRKVLKQQLLDAIAPLDRGAAATDDDKETIEELCQQLEAVNPTRAALKSPLINGKWELLYTTSETILGANRPKLFRPNGKICQAINAKELAAQNIESAPFFNQVTAKLEPMGPNKVNVKFQTFKIFGLISIKSPETSRGELEITYLDEDMRISRGNRGNLFVLTMDDPDYKIPFPL